MNMEIEKAADLIREYCSKRIGCDGCEFEGVLSCALINSNPEDWPPFSKSEKGEQNA